MALVLADRVRETTTTTGTGTISLGGPVSGFQGFSTAIGNANTTYYTIADAATGAWEVGLGTYTSAGSTLARTTILSSSNSGSAVNFAAGTKDVFVTQPAERALYLNGAGTGVDAGAAAFTSNGVVYASSTSALATGSALTFDGTNLGIGTASPVTKLDVRYTSFTPTSTISSILVEESTAWAQGIQFYINNAGTFASSRPSGAIGVANSTQVFLTGSCIVTNNHGTSNGFTASSTAASIYVCGAGTHIWYTNTGLTAGSTFTQTERARITSAGNVVIGSTDADPLSLARERNLAIVTTGTNSALTIVGGGAARIDFGVGATRTAGVYSDATNFTEIFTTTALPLVFSTNNTQRARIDSDGTFRVKGAGTAGTTDAFQVAGTAPADSMVLNSSGNLGVGTASPNNKLTAQADATGASFADNGVAQIIARGNTDSTKRLGLGIDTTNNIGVIQAQKFGTGTYPLAINPAGGDVGIGTASPAAKLHIAVASAAVDGTKGVRITNPAGTIAVFECGSVGDSFIGTTSGSDFNIRTGNAVVATFLNGGNVGIGNTSPSSYNAAADNLVIGSSGSNGMTIVSGTTSAGYIMFADGTVGQQAYEGQITYDHASNFMAFNTSATERARISADGTFRVKGAGTAGTTDAFQVAGAAPADAARIDSSGNLLVGTTAPYIAAFTGISAQGLTSGTGNLSLGLSKAGTPQILSGDVLGNIYFYGVDNDVTAGNNNIGARIASIATTNWTTDGTTSNAALVFYTHGTTSGAPEERARITSAGNLQVGVAGTNNGRLDINTGSGTYIIDAINSAGARYFAVDKGAPADSFYVTSAGNLLVGTATAISSGSSIVNLGTARQVLTIKGDADGSYTQGIWSATTTGDNLFTYFATEASINVRGSISYNRAGGVVLYNTTSDYRAKDIIGPVQNPGATIDALKVYEGQMKGATQSRPMLIAHEAQALTPYAVTGKKDAVNEDGTPKYQQMDVSSLVPLMLAELQSLRARVASLESSTLQ